MATTSWKEITEPLTSFNAQIEFKEGLAAELHQQNVSLKVDPKTRKILGFVLGDMDSYSINYSLRVNRLKKPVLTRWSETLARIFLYGDTQERVFISYFEKVRLRSTKWLFSEVLSGKDMKELLNRADGLMMSRFHDAFPEYQPSNLFELSRDIDHLNKKSTTADERIMYQKIDGLSSPPSFINKLRTRLRERELKKSSGGSTSSVQNNVPNNVQINVQINCSALFAN